MDVRLQARRAAVLQLIAARYRELARGGAVARLDLEREAAWLEKLAASLLSMAMMPSRDTPALSAPS